MRSRGFTLVEILVATAIVALLITSAISFLQGGLKGFKKGSDRLETMKTCRNVLERLRKDIREGVNKFEVVEPEASATPKPYILKFDKFELDEEGYPVVQDGEFKEVQVTYEFDDAKRVLVRSLDGDTRTVAKNIDEISFSLLNFTLASNNEKILAVMIEISAEVDFEVTKFRTVVMPRYIAKWAEEPDWVINSIANTLTLKAD